MDKKLKKRLHELWQANARLWTQIWDDQAELMRLGKEIETIKTCKADDEQMKRFDENVTALYKMINYVRNAADIEGDSTDDAVNHMRAMGESARRWLEKFCDEIEREFSTPECEGQL